MKQLYSEMIKKAKYDHFEKLQTLKTQLTSTLFRLLMRYT